MREENWSFFSPKKLTLQDWITMFSFFVLVVLLDAGLFFGGGRVSFLVTTTLINRSEDLQVEIGLKHIGTT